MENQIYTVITFAPVQGFIEKSRKLRDLYGSSYLLSYLSWVICNAAEEYGCTVVSPALPNITQGMPNQIIIEGNFPEPEAKSVLLTAWECVTETCRLWIENHLPGDYRGWKRSWSLWSRYAWEFFWVQGNPGESITQVREKLNEKKRARDWTGINWQGESSTLSGVDAIAYPKLGNISDPRQYSYQQERKDVTTFYTALSQKLGESFIDPKEELSIPELIKRMITYESVSNQFIENFRNSFGKDTEDIQLLVKEIQQISNDLQPSSFKDLNRHNENKGFQGWFQGDGDKAGDYLKKYPNPDEIHNFSSMMRKWGKDFKEKSPLFCRVIYAGGDDFLGIFYDAKEGRSLDSSNCVQQLSRFKADIWDKPEKKPISASVGFVWAPPSVPQRDVLQHCRDAEKSAKNNGRDRIAFRVLFNNGNYIEWVCPWQILEQGLLTSYCDRERKPNKKEQNWTHIYNDVAVLESRHAFTKHSTDVAFGLLEIYFPTQKIIAIPDVLKENDNQWWEQDVWWNKKEDGVVISTGILGDVKNYYKKNTNKLDAEKVNAALNNWVINLAKVGFHLC